MPVVALLTTPVPTVPATADTLTGACGRSAGIACRLVWDLSHSVHAADFTSVYLAGPIGLVLRIAFVVLLAVAIRIGAQRVINRVARRATAARSKDDGSADDDQGQDEDLEVAAAEGADGETTAGPRALPVRPGRRSQRATALASVLSNAASLTIFAVAGVIILGDLGLNLAPVLASAGVLGIAIGFGAQNLVQDFLAGIFMLLEDQYGVGDVVDIGPVTGTVEGVSLRITRVRDVNGIVWHIRNGTIERAGNETHGWARAVIDFPVPYQVPLATARNHLERAALSMWEEPAWHALMLDRPQVWGVEDISTDTIVIRVAARTLPQGKAEVARELRERLKFALDSTVRAVRGPAGAAAGAALAEAVPLQSEPPPE